MTGEVIENTLSEHGLRWLHVARMGAPVDKKYWMSRISFYAVGVGTQTQHEPGLDVHHLRMWWQAREAVVLQGAADGLTGKRVLLWYVERGQSLREAALYAGVAYLEEFGRWPRAVLVRKIPKNSPGEIELWADEQVSARLIEAEWVPRNFLVLTEEAP